MSAPITESHRELARNIMFYHTPEGSATAQGVRDAAQLIADSEAKACEQLRAALALEQQNCDDAYDELRADCDELRGDVVRLAAERDELRAEVDRPDAMYQRACEVEHQLRAEVVTAKKILNEETNRAERAEAELATERARLDAGTILLTVAGERVWHCGVDLRSAIDAGMREAAK